MIPQKTVEVRDQMDIDIRTKITAAPGLRFGNNGGIDA